MTRYERPDQEYYQDHSVIDELIELRQKRPQLAGRLSLEVCLGMPKDERDAHFKNSGLLDLLKIDSPSNTRKLELDIENDMLLLEYLSPTDKEVRRPNGASVVDEGLPH